VDVGAGAMMLSGVAIGTLGIDAECGGSGVKPGGTVGMALPLVTILENMLASCSSAAC
jgi:hypothetical protein